MTSPSPLRIAAVGDLHLGLDSAGLGEAMVTMLAAEGAAVVVHGRNARRAHSVAERVREAGGTVAVACGGGATRDRAASSFADRAARSHAQTKLNS